MRRTRPRKSKKKCTFRNSGTPERRTGLLCAEQNVGNLKTGLSGILGLLCAEQNVGNLTKNTLLGFLGLLCAEQHVGNLNDVRSRFLGLLCAEQDVGNLNKFIFRNSGTHKTSKSQHTCTFKNSGTPARPPDPPKGAPRPWLQWLVSFRLTESLAHRRSPTHPPPSPRPLPPNPPDTCQYNISQ